MRQKDTNVNNNARMREFADIAHFAKVTDRRQEEAAAPAGGCRVPCRSDWDPAPD